MTDRLRMDGKVAVVTGAGGDIGGAACVIMARRGASIVAVDRSVEGLKGLSDRMPAGAGFLAVEADVRSEESVQAYVQAALSKFGRIDAFFNNAGIEGSRTGAFCYTHELSLDDFNDIMSVNSTGVFLGMKHVLKVMLDAGRGGSIINTSSINGIKGSRGQSAYCASKHAVMGMSRTAALEYGPSNIRVNCINPGPIKGRMMQDFVGIIADQMGGVAPIAKPMDNDNTVGWTHPLARYADPSEAGELVAFLASDAASYITGAFYPVDGGMSAM